MLIQPVASNLITRPVHTRIPFKFGVQILNEVPLAELAVEVETSDGRRMVGRSSDLLVPKWFEKNPDTTPAEDSEALARSISEAVNLAIELGRTAGAHSAFDIWHVSYQDLVARHPNHQPDILVRGFGTHMLERALIDATCRLADCTFREAILNDRLGFSASRVIPATRDWLPARLPMPADSISVRHTVGMLDPLRLSDIPPEQRIEDGLPQALEEDIDAYGLKWFKIKVGGNPQQDARRLKDIASVVMPKVGNDAAFTLDGNEQCEDLESFAGMLEDLKSDPIAGALVERLTLIEQPLPRTATFDPAANRHLNQLSAIAPVIIDEADTDSEAFHRAISLGYSGVSIKACKGIFRALANRALIDLHPNQGLFQSGEDLTNLGSIPLQQDLALQSTLGVSNVERNGHHYFRGLDHLPEDQQAMITRALPGLYHRDADLTRLSIRNGTIDLKGIRDGIGLGGPLASLEAAKAINPE